MPLYSHSRISAYESCPRKYRYRYVDRIKLRVDTVEAFLGKRVHETLEKLYGDVRRGALPTLPGLLSYFEGRWERNWHEGVRIVRGGRSADGYNQVGRECIEGYFQRFVPFDQTRTISLEERVVFPLDGTGRYKMQGYIDRLAEAPDGTIEIHDYKTSESLPSQEVLDADRQLALYQIGVEEKRGGDHRIVLVWHYLRHGETITSKRGPEDLDRLRAETIDRIREIESAEEFPTRESRLCAWCDFVEICPVWKDRPAPWPI